MIHVHILNQPNVLHINRNTVNAKSCQSVRISCDYLWVNILGQDLFQPCEMEGMCVSDLYPTSTHISI